MRPPVLTYSERIAALDRAAQIRRARASMCQQLKAGELTLAEVLSLADSDIVAGRARVAEILESMPGYGRARARRLMWDVGISEGRRLRGLGARQRARLLDAL